MRRLLVLAPLLGASVSGCDLFVATGGDDGGDGGGGTGFQTPASVPADLDCKPLYDTPAPGGDGLDSCVTAELSCGDTVTGTVEGGSSELSNESGEAWEWCSGHSTGSELAGPERVYEVHPGATDTYASVHLESCDKLQLLWYQTANACPHDHVNCSYVTVDGSLDQREDILLSGSGVLWVVVEGIDGTSGNFQLTVDCGS